MYHNFLIVGSCWHDSTGVVLYGNTSYVFIGSMGKKSVYDKSGSELVNVGREETR